MKTNKKIAVASALAVCSCFCLAACNKTSKKFDAPENVRIAVDTLSWDEVTGATNGYTVKINSDETTTVSTTSLDLTTVTAKLNVGDNTLSVRVNAADKMGASAYSTEVTYTYTPSATSGPFSKPTVTLSGDTLSWRAVDGASNGYTVKSDLGTITVSVASVNLKTEAKSILKVGDNSLAVKVNAAGDRAESEYSDSVSYNYVVTPEEEAEGFVEVVDAIGTVTADSQSKIEAAKTKYNNLTDGAKAVSATATALATLKEKDCAFYGLLVGAIGTVSKNSTLAELDAAKAAIDVASAYYGTLLDNTGAASSYATFGQKKDAYDTAIIEIETEVDGIAENVEDLLGSMPDEQTKAALRPYYDSLAENKEAIDDLAEYAEKYWNDNYNSTLYSSLTAKINEVLSIHVDNAKETKESAPFINFEHGGKTEIYITRKYLNVLDKGVSVTNPATATLTVEGQEQTGVAGVFDEVSGCYVYKISTTWPVADSTTEPVTYAESVDVSYQLSDGNKVDITINKPSSIIWSDASTYKFLNDQGELQCYGVTGKPLYADVYAATDIVAEGRDNDISAKGAPLATISIANGMTENDLKFLLARNDILGENLKLRLVVYEKTVEGVYSIINSSSVSEVLTFDITEIDRYFTLPTDGLDIGVYDTGDYNFTLIGNLELNDLYSFINSNLAADNITDCDVSASNAADNIGIKIEAVSPSATFTKVVPLQNQGYSYKQLVTDWSKQYYTENPTATTGTTYSGIKIYISYCILDSAPQSLKTYFPKSERAQLVPNNDTIKTMITSVTLLNKSELKLPSTGMEVASNDANYIVFLHDEGGNGKVLTDGDAKYLEIKFYAPRTVNGQIVETNVNYAYLYNVGNNAYICKNIADIGKTSGTGIIGANAINDSSVTRSVLKDYVESNYGVYWNYGWSFTSRYVLSDNSNKYMYNGDWSEAIDMGGYALNTPQINFDGSNFVFLEAFTPTGSTEIGRGDLLKNDIADKVELHFYKGNTETTAYSIYMTYDGSGYLEFYYDKEGVKTAITAAIDGQLDIGNGWCQKGSVIDMISEYLTETGSSDSVSGTWKMYTVTHFKDNAKMFQNVDDNGNVKSDTYSFTVE